MRQHCSDRSWSSAVVLSIRGVPWCHEPELEGRPQWDGLRLPGEPGADLEEVVPI